MENSTMMKLGFVSAILPDLSLEEVFQTASDIGYQCVEVMCWPLGKATRRYAGVTHIDVARLDEAEIDSIGQLSAKYSVEISGLGFAAGGVVERDKITMEAKFEEDLFKVAGDAPYYLAPERLRLLGLAGQPVPFGSRNGSNPAG